MTDIINPYGGTDPSRTQNQNAFNSAMKEFVPFLTGLPSELNKAIAYINALMDVSWYNNSTVYNQTGSTKPSFVYGSNGFLYVCIGTDVVGDDPVSSVTGDWVRMTEPAGSSTTDIMPIGASFFWDYETPPDGSYERDGSEISRTGHADLYSLWGTRFGDGDGSTTFNLPANNGEFPRARDNGAGVDPDAASRTDRGDGTTGDAIGTKQASANKLHAHTLSCGAFDGSYASRPAGGNAYTFTGATTSNSGGNEARPINFYTMFCVRAY